jgi:hypothetical protein
MQEAQWQELASLQMHVDQQTALVEARYTKQLQQSEQAFQQELGQREQVMQQELQQRTETIQWELYLEMQRKEEAMRRSLDLQLANVQVSNYIRWPLAVCTEISW